MSHSDVIIVGGGVIGAMSAYYLNRQGARVTIIDRARFGAACSHGNCGYICPSHALPLPRPGVISKMMWTVFSKSSPLYIKPRLSWSLWMWMLNFTRRCNERDMLASADVLSALLNSSRALYDELVQSEQLACDWEDRGLLFVYHSRAEFDHYASTAQMLLERYNLEARRYDADALLQLEPSLKPGAAAGAWLYPIDAHVRPDRLMAEMRRILQSRGVKIIEDCEMQGLDRSNGQATALRTSQGDMRADRFVIATGAMTPMISKHLGCRIPIQPGKGYSITMSRPSVCPTYPMIFEEHRVAVTPWGSGYRIGSTMEFSGYDTFLDPARLENLKRGAEVYLKEPHCDPVTESWYGWRPMTWDSLPIIDRTPAMSNVVLAVGHNMLGLSLGAVTGKLVSEIISGTPAHVGLDACRISRFQ